MLIEVTCVTFAVRLLLLRTSKVGRVREQGGKERDGGVGSEWVGVALVGEGGSI